MLKAHQWLSLQKKTKNGGNNRGKKGDDDWQPSHEEISQGPWWNWM